MEMRTQELWLRPASGHGAIEQIRKCRGFARCKWVDHTKEADGKVIKLDKLGWFQRVVSGYDKIPCMGR